jgi:hypothetical protein
VVLEVVLGRRREGTPAFATTRFTGWEERNTRRLTRRAR